MQPIGRPSLAQTDELAVKLASDAIADIREAGIGVNSANAMPLIYTIFCLNSPSFKAGKIVIDRRWVRGFLAQHCSMSYRRVTNAAKKVPDNAPQLIAEFVERCAVLMNVFGIHEELVINFDQSGISLVPSTAFSYDKRNAKRVAVAHFEDKRQITAVVSSSLTGEMLPMQLVFTGKTNKCHPTRAALAEVKADAFLHKFKFAHSENHWSSQETMVQLIEEVNNHSA